MMRNCTKLFIYAFCIYVPAKLENNSPEEDFFETNEFQSLAMDRIFLARLWAICFHTYFSFHDHLTCRKLHYTLVMMDQ